MTDDDKQAIEIVTKLIKNRDVLAFRIFEIDRAIAALKRVYEPQEQSAATEPKP